MLWVHQAKGGEEAIHRTELAESLGGLMKEATVVLTEQLLSTDYVANVYRIEADLKERRSQKKQRKKDELSRTQGALGKPADPQKPCCCGINSAQ